MVDDNTDSGRHRFGAEAAVDASAVEAEEATESLTPGAFPAPVESDGATDALPGPPPPGLAPMSPAASPFGATAGRPAAGRPADGRSAESQWGSAQPPISRWQAPAETPAPPAPPQRQVPPAAAPRRVVQPPAEGKARDGQPGRAVPEDATQQFSRQEFDKMLRNSGQPQRPAGPTTRPRPDGGPQIGDTYGRPASSPLQRAGTGMRSELFAARGGDVSPLASVGWRKFLNQCGLKLAPGNKERSHRELVHRIRASKPEMYSIAVLTLKGGAGKTTVTSTLGQVFAKYRADAVMAVDADPASGDLPLRTASHPQNLSLVDMLAEQNLNQRDYVARFMSTTDSDLQVLASGWRADSDQVLEPDDIRDVHEIASHYYSLLLWDADVNLHSSLVREVLAKSNALVLLVQATPQGSLAAGDALDWLRCNGFDGLLARTVLLVNQSKRKTHIDLKALIALLRREQIKIHRVPFDEHLDEGMAVDLDKLAKPTRRAFEELAAMLADDFITPRSPVHEPAAS
jgi:MinD-like ATPase involved in chromosome partitioning or flagellar assembly